MLIHATFRIFRSKYLYFSFQVKDILQSASVSNDELVAVQSEIDRISDALGDTTSNLDALDNDLANIRQSLLQVK